MLLNLHPADIALLISTLHDEEDQRYLFALVRESEQASDVLAELPTAVRENVIAEIPHHELADLVEEMESDDAADLLQELEPELADQVLQGIEPEEREAMRPLLVHREDTAGGIMATEVLTVNVNDTVGDARETVRARHEDVGAFFNVYVVDEAKRLKGILSVKDLVLQHSSTPAREAMNTDIATVPPDMDQEEVANIFRRYDLVAVPVVDEEGVLLGRITVDDVVDVMREEAEEDIARMAGTVDFDFDESSARRVALLRLPWLVVSLFGGLLAGVVLHHFTSVLTHELLMLVAFVPVITAMGGNSGTQAAVTTVRRLALQQLQNRDVVNIVLREARVGVALGLMCGLVVAGGRAGVEGNLVLRMRGGSGDDDGGAGRHHHGIRSAHRLPPSSRRSRHRHRSLRLDVQRRHRSPDLLRPRHRSPAALSEGRRRSRPDAEPADASRPDDAGHPGPLPAAGRHEHDDVGLDAHHQRRACPHARSRTQPRRLRDRVRDERLSGESGLRASAGHHRLVPRARAPSDRSCGSRSGSAWRSPLVECLIVFTPVAPFIFRRLLGASEALTAPAVLALRAGILFPLLVAVRSAFQGVLVGRRRSAPIAVGTFLRLLFLAVMVFTVVPRVPWGGPVTAMLALAAAVLVETLYVIVVTMRTPEREESTSPAHEAGRRLSGKVRFLAPLAWTMVLGSLTNPLVNAFIARTPDPEQGLAVYSVVASLIWFMASSVLRFSSVTIALGTTRTNLRRLERFLWRYVGGVCAPSFSSRSPRRRGSCSSESSGSPRSWPPVRACPLRFSRCSLWWRGSSPTSRGFSPAAPTPRRSGSRG